MGVSIGVIGRNLPSPVSNAPTAQAGAVRPRIAPDPAPRRTDALRSQTSSPFAEAVRDEPGLPEAGFGRGTLSPPGAALEALGRGVRSVRESLPSLAERREVIRERFDGLRELQRETVQAVDAPEPRPEAETAPPPSPTSAASESAARTQSEQVRSIERRETEPNGGFGLRRAETAAPPQFVDVRV